MSGALDAPAVKRFDAGAEHPTAEDCHINELSNDPADEAVSIARARVEPGVTTRWHRLRGIAERYVITEGRGRIEIGGLAPQLVGPGDVVLIPAECPQRIANVGVADLVFLAICTPRFRPAAYDAIEGPAEPAREEKP